MPNATTIEQLLGSRLQRSLDAWAERLVRELHDTGSRHLAVVRISLAPACPGPLELADAAARLRVRIRRHLGGSEYVVELTDHAHQNRLALEGHLDVTEGPFRLTAV